MVPFLLTIALLLHLLAVAVWIGGIAFFLIVFTPAVHDVEPGLGMRALNRGRVSLETIGWVALATVLLSGIVAFLLRLQATGAAVPISYIVLLSVKIFLFLAMLVHHCLQVFKYGPRIASLTAALPAQPESWAEPLLSHWRRWFLLLKINSVMGLIVVVVGVMRRQ
jgi:uncharacterized membrane protein